MNLLTAMGLQGLSIENLFSHLLLFSLFITTFYFLHTIHPSSALGFNLTNIGPQDQNVHIKTFADAYISLQGILVANDERGSNLQQRAGKAVYAHLLPLWDKASGNLTNFTTHYVFVIDSTNNSDFADGLAFFLPPMGANLSAGGAMGLPIDPRNGTATSSFFAVEFDTYQNPWDPQHINPITHVGSRNNTRVEGSLHLLVDLSYLPESVEFDFSASTGTNFEKNNVKSWQFSSSLQIDENPVSPPPSLPARKRKKRYKWAFGVGLTVGSCALVGLIGLGLWKMRKGKEEENFGFDPSIESAFEMSSGPKKFSYNQLSRSTSNFAEE
ncbi:unnamed protein product [Thlaspi arvense]|uniref:Legume lectin domain-containing protein n=1 Tax=Thlaspi arvense TaxID=13288 RepID=A0AAU9RMD1_THLAR|nr:unnamed protein product [Thlaspi arvense]